MKARGKRILAATAALAALACVPGCKVGYLLSSGYYQAELLASREPVTELREQGVLSEAQVQRLDLIADVKAYGAEIGLQATDNYETLAWQWERTIWNVTGCEPLSFTPKTWWFPVVGRFPYLGYFREQDARDLEARLQSQGYDTYVRTAGAYSTLGWFKDPILPDMLTWSDYRLADTVLHELAHATLWVPGSVHFNESYANFVGEVAAMRYLQTRRGSHDPELLAAIQRQTDRERFRELLHALYKDLDTLYQDPELSDADKLAQKEQLLGPGLEQRVQDAGLINEDGYLKMVRETEWNNARLVQFKTYNSNEALFAAILEEQEGDLLGFIHRIEEITADADDPFIALEGAVSQP